MSEDTPTTTEEKLDPTDSTVKELRTLVENVYSVEVLARMRELEADGDDRKTAKEAIDDRIAELEADNVASDTAEPATPTDDESQAVVDESDTTPTDDATGGGGSDHGTLPRSAANPDTIVVRNPGKTTLHLQGLKGSLGPGETREYPESDRLMQYIRNNTLQVVRSN